ncbi:hypothetical protein EJ06DRAFT_257144 [Trichodelitschia bisporula]|uniref:GAG-pre-integrase domain-containing protein n=1 Tax=Trichodelitschia bisporula TaxID=703511 RepID=A0A6G1HJ39_9PEZI|nr:hypothetical protein EJ06DRAFT_257144 [Trichodelitschia bisporula]
MKREYRNWLATDEGKEWYKSQEGQRYRQSDERSQDWPANHTNRQEDEAMNRHGGDEETFTQSSRGRAKRLHLRRGSECRGDSSRRTTGVDAGHGCNEAHLQHMRSVYRRNAEESSRPSESRKQQLDESGLDGNRPGQAARRSAKLRETLYCFESPFNLVSLGQLSDCGVTFSGNAQQIRLIYQGKELATAERHRKLYQLKSVRLRGVILSADAQLSLKHDEIMHKRLGHMGQSREARIHEVADGIQRKISHQRTCDACRRAKTTKRIGKTPIEPVENCLNEFTSITGGQRRNHRSTEEP